MKLYKRLVPNKRWWSVFGAEPPGNEKFPADMASAFGSYRPLTLLPLSAVKDLVLILEPRG